jgi:hypothetical protein
VSAHVEALVSSFILKFLVTFAIECGSFQSFAAGRVGIGARLGGGLALPGISRASAGAARRGSRPPGLREAVCIIEIVCAHPICTAECAVMVVM